MPRPSNPLAAASGAMVAFFGVLMTMIGLAGASEPSEIRAVMVVMALAGGAMVYGGIQMILTWRRAEKRMEEDMRIMHAPNAVPAAAVLPAAPARTVTEEGVPVYEEQLNPPRPDDAPPELLAVWSYDPGEWGTYTAGEMKAKGSEMLWTGVVLVVVGTWIFKEDAGLWAGFSYSAGFAMFICGLQWAIARSAHEKNVAVPSGDVRITTHAVLLNGTYLVLNDDHNHVGKATLVPGEPSILEVKVEWSTRNGPTHELIRIPVPAGREEEAERVRLRLLAEAGA